MPLRDEQRWEDRAGVVVYYCPGLLIRRANPATRMEGKMRVLVTGSRDWEDYDAVHNMLAYYVAMYSGDVEMCHGGAAGADALAAKAAAVLGIPIKVYPADWRNEGRRAGPLRNKRMLEDFKPHVVLAFPLPQSKGTVHMMEIARAAGVPVAEWPKAVFPSTHLP